MSSSMILCSQKNYITWQILRPSICTALMKHLQHMRYTTRMCPKRVKGREHKEESMRSWNLKIPKKASHPPSSASCDNRALPVLLLPLAFLCLLEFLPRGLLVCSPPQEPAASNVAPIQTRKNSSVQTLVGPLSPDKKLQFWEYFFLGGHLHRSSAPAVQLLLAVLTCKCEHNLEICHYQVMNKCNHMRNPSIKFCNGQYEVERTHFFLLQ